MATKTVKTVARDQSKAIIKFNDEFDEYVVKFHTGNVYHKNADYFTDSKADAVATAEHWVNSLYEGAN